MDDNLEVSGRSVQKWLIAQRKPMLLLLVFFRGNGAPGLTNRHISQLPPLITRDL